MKNPLALDRTTVPGLIVISAVCGALGFLAMPKEGQAIGLIWFGVLIAVWARIAQAARQHRELLTRR